MSAGREGIRVMTPTGNMCGTDWLVEQDLLHGDRSFAMRWLAPKLETHTRTRQPAPSAPDTWLAGYTKRQAARAARTPIYGTRTAPADSVDTTEEITLRETRNREPWQAIHISADAFAFMDALTRRYSSREVAGSLLGERIRSWQPTRIVEATGFESGRSTRDSLVFNVDELHGDGERIRRVYDWSDGDVVGMWHSHPLSCSVEPSPADLRCALNIHDERGRSETPFITLIAALQWDAQRQREVLTLGAWGVRRRLDHPDQVPVYQQLDVTVATS